MNDGEAAFRSWTPPPLGTPVPGPVPSRLLWRVTYWVTLGLLCAAAAGLLTGFFLTGGAVRMPSAGMAPAIRPGDVVSYERGVSGIVRGDIVMVQVAGIGLVMKRLIGLPGDRVTCCDQVGRVAVNGKALSEDYLLPGAAPSQVSFTVTTGPGQVWVMGDNRPISRDSREWGPVPMSDIVGRVYQVSPVSGWRVLRTPTAYTAAGLAPADHRVPLQLLLGEFAVLAVLAVIGQGTAGIVLAASRRRRERQQSPMVRVNIPG